MHRDPLFRSILERLDGPLDPILFERCVGQLLPTVQPGLAPVVGGNDGGLDGAIGDGEGTAFPLVCTTAEDVARNLTKNLRSYVDKKDKRRRAVLATSRAVNGDYRRKLEGAAADLGFTLVNIYDRETIARLLYRSREWCLELLGIPGNPPPLSAFAENARPSLTSTLVGRDSDLVWLSQTSGDLVVEGQPGSGKTFLLSALAEAGEGLFVVTNDLTLIVGAVREQEPTVLLVDDAHLRLDLLTQLRQCRRDTGATFRIIADCWPGERDGVVRALGSVASVRTLEPLTRSEILEVVKACGIAGPNRLLHELVRQAEGRPGLAVTLCYLCLRKGIEPIAHADALYDDVRATFARLVGREAIPVLAAFAVGGEFGMPTEVVARHLSLPRATVWSIANLLSVGGVLRSLGNQILAVRPEALRHALVREVYFGANGSIPINEILGAAPNAESAAQTLIGARGRNGRVPFDLLTVVMECCTSPGAWQQFASLGPIESKWALERHPRRLLTVAPVALEHIPDAVLPMLLAAGINGGAGEDSPGPLQLIDRWVKTAFPGSADFLRRRQAVHRAALDMFDAGGTVPVALTAACSALGPDFAAWETHPSEPYRLTRYHGCGLPEELTALTELWPPLLERLRRVRMEDWTPLQRLVRIWAHPEVAAIGHMHPETRKQARVFASHLLQDLARLASGRLGILRWAAEQARHLELSLDVLPDPDFLVLYPTLFMRGDWRAERERQAEEARQLAVRWAAEEPAFVVRRLAHFEWEAEQAESGARASLGGFVCLEIAGRVTSLGEWLDALCEAEVGPDLVEPFLRLSVVRMEPGWQKRLASCLARPRTRGAALHVILQLAEPPVGLLDEALTRIEEFPEIVDSLCFRGGLPVDRVRLLLRHNDRQVAGRAASGEWHAEPTGQVRPELRPEWRAAVVRCLEYPDESMLRSDPELALDWLEARVREQHVALQEQGSVNEALKLLTATQRGELLAAVPSDYGGASAVRLLVSEDPEVYRCLLAEERLRRHHLVPLQGRPQGAWPALAVQALDRGYTLQQIARATLGDSWAWRGDESAMWDEWLNDFRRLESASDPRLVEIGRMGCEQVQELAERARTQERYEAVYGED